MIEIANVTMQTPIEMALGIDENGMTTAKMLYDFLGLNQKNYSRWVKNNITENEFAEENVDFWAVFPDEDRKFNPCPTQDFKLTASFAKKLSMQQKNERGEQARQYFVAVEDKAKDMVLMLKQAADNPIKLLELHYKALKEVDGRVEVLADDLNEVKGDYGKRIEHLENNMTLDYGQQKVLEDAVNKTVIEVLGGKDSSAYEGIGRKVFAECNRDLKHYFNVNARANVPRKRFDEAVEYANNWKPCNNTVIRIQNYNAQQTLEV